MKRSEMTRLGVERVVRRKMALRFSHAEMLPGRGVMHMKIADCTATFGGEKPGIVYWPLGGRSIVVSFEADGYSKNYGLPIEEIVHAAIRWAKSRA